MLSAEAFRSAKYHIVNPFDGVVGRRFRCQRCLRQLPEGRFYPVADFHAQAHKKYGKVLILSPVCSGCKRQMRGEWARHPMYSPKLDRYWSERLMSLKAGARARGIFVGLERDDLLGQFIKQEGRCALTGLEMNWLAKGMRGRGLRSKNAPSVDRIDSSKDYLPGNIQMVLSVVNLMKNDLPHDAFIEMCRQVATHNMTF